MIELLAITRRRRAAAAGSLRALAAGGLAGVVAPAEPTSEATAESLWRHEELVEALMADRDVLPVRFGTRSPTTRTPRRRSPRAARRSPRRSSTCAAPSSCRCARDRRGRPAATHAALSELAARALARDSSTAGAGVLRAAYLVDRGGGRRLRARVARLQDAQARR